MEKIITKIRIFFADYGSLIFKGVFILIFFILILRGVNNLHIAEKNSQENIVENKINEIPEVIEDENIISKFINYCNNQQIDKAYDMISDDCKSQKYKTIDEFKSIYIDKVFPYTKEFSMEKKDGFYEVTVLEGILQSGSKEKRGKITCNLQIVETILENKIYIREVIK